MKITVLAFDLSANAAGRADLLARLLMARYEVAVVGPRFGPAVWRPVRDGTVRYREVAGTRLPRFLARVPALLRFTEGDVVVASKPRPTSYGLALLARARRAVPVLLDIDDWEAGFFYRTGAWGRVGRALNVSNPNGLAWTWLMERFAARADAITVASRFLQARFGGTLIPHVRDTEAWRPELFDRAAGRAALGVGAEKVVMFLGTPRGHKGVDDLVEAVRGLGDGVRLALVGADPRRAERWASLSFVTVVGEVALDDVPRWLVAADAVAIPQRATSDTLGQVPAKLFDAMALARPIVSTTVSMIPEILEGCGRLVPPGDVRALREALRELLADPEQSAALGHRARARCEAHYSYGAARAALFPVIERLLERRRR